MRVNQSILEVTGSVLFKGPDTLASFQRKTRSLLRGLEKVHGGFANWSVLGSSDFVAVKRDLSNLEEQISDLYSDSSDENLIPSSGESKFGPGAMNRIGFSASLATKLPSDRIGVSNTIELFVQGCSANVDSSGGVSIAVPLLLCSPREWPAIARQIVEVVSLAWNLSVVLVGYKAFEEAIKVDGDMYSGQWMTYFRMAQARDCLASTCNTLLMSDGILIETASHLPDVENPSDIAAAKRLREALDHLGLVWHSTYAIHGWPPDEEEWRYEEFITGAPHDRKYRVRCIDFDGYDSQRDVLLYAKLFRRLRQQRKEWGLRGWDGPVLNEARRQVRAANGTQIEWHVGLEEPAARVRTLLADYTDFREEQLRVIHTPVSQMAAR